MKRISLFASLVGGVALLSSCTIDVNTDGERAATINIDTDNDAVAVDLADTELSVNSGSDGEVTVTANGNTVNVGSTNDGVSVDVVSDDGESVSVEAGDNEVSVESEDSGVQVSTETNTVVTARNENESVRVEVDTNNDSVEVRTGTHDEQDVCDAEERSGDVYTAEVINKGERIIYTNENVVINSLSVDGEVIVKGNAVINFVQISESGILKALDNVVINTGKNEGVVYTSEEVVVNSVTGSGDIKVEGGLAESLCEMADSEVGVSGNSRVRVESGSESVDVSTRTGNDVEVRGNGSSVGVEPGEVRVNGNSIGVSNDNVRINDAINIDF